MSNFVSIDEDTTEDIPHLSKKTVLTSSSVEKEVYDDISQMKNNKMLGPDGFPVEFYQRCGGLSHRPNVFV